MPIRRPPMTKDVRVGLEALLVMSDDGKNTPQVNAARTWINSMLERQAAVTPKKPRKK